MFAGAAASLFPSNLPQNSRERLLWAYVLILSRAWAASRSGSSARALQDKIVIPGFDILNHNVAAMEGSKVAVVRFDEHEAVLITEHFFAAAEEIFTSYGAKSNAHLLFQYGFSLHPNRYDWIELAIPLRRDDEAESLGGSRCSHRLSLSLQPRAPIMMHCRASGLAELGLRHKTIVFSVGGCALADDAASITAFCSNSSCCCCCCCCCSSCYFI
jgi:hypothetical protein